MKIRRFSDGEDWVELWNGFYRSSFYGLDWDEALVGPEHFMWGPWKEVFSGFDPNDIQGTALWRSGNGKPCCGGTSGQAPYEYVGGTWHAADCDSLKPPILPQPAALTDYRAPASKKGLCTCGSAAVGSDRHSHWCDIK